MFTNSGLFNSNSVSILFGKISSHSELSTFIEYLVPGDNDCGFTVLETNRDELSTVLASLADSETARIMLMREIQEAFVSKSWKGAPEEWKSYFEALVESDTALQNALNSIKDKAGLSEALNYDSACKFLEAQADTEQLNRLLLLSDAANKARETFETYCKRKEVFLAYVNALRISAPSECLWLGYESAQLYAKAKNISLNIWKRSIKDSSQLELVVEGEKTASSKVIHALHTGHATHFNLLLEYQGIENESVGAGAGSMPIIARSSSSEEQELRVNTLFLYQEQHILKVIDAYIRKQGLHFLTDKGGRIHPEASLFTSKDHTMRVDSAGILMKGDVFYRNIEGESLSLCGPVRYSGLSLPALEDYKGDLAVAVSQLKAVGIDKFAKHSILFPYYIHENHWGLGILRLNLIDKQAQLSIIDPYRISNTISREAFRQIKQLLKEELNIEHLVNKEYLGVSQQYDGASCGAISAENAIALITGNEEILNQTYPEGAKALRHRHLKLIEDARFYQDQLENRAYSDISNAKPSKELVDAWQAMIQALSPEENLLLIENLHDDAIKNAQNIRNFLFDIKDKHPAFFDKNKQLFNLLFKDLSSREFKDTRIVDVLHAITSSTGMSVASQLTEHFIPVLTETTEAQQDDLHLITSVVKETELRLSEIHAEQAIYDSKKAEIEIRKKLDTRLAELDANIKKLEAEYNRFDTEIKSNVALLAMQLTTQTARKEEATSDEVLKQRVKSFISGKERDHLFISLEAAAVRRKDEHKFLNVESEIKQLSDLKEQVESKLTIFVAEEFTLGTTKKAALAEKSKQEKDIGNIKKNKAKLEKDLASLTERKTKLDNQKKDYLDQITKQQKNFDANDAALTKERAEVKRFTIDIASGGGPHDLQNRNFIKIDGVRAGAAARGIDIAIVNSKTGRVKHYQTFDTYADPGAAGRASDFIKANYSYDDVIYLACVDEMSVHFGALRGTLAEKIGVSDESLGAVGWRHPWVSAQWFEAGSKKGVTTYIKASDTFFSKSYVCDRIAEVHASVDSRKAILRTAVDREIVRLKGLADKVQDQIVKLNGDIVECDAAIKNCDVSIGKNNDLIKLQDVRIAELDKDIAQKQGYIGSYRSLITAYDAQIDGLRAGKGKKVSGDKTDLMPAMPAVDLSGIARGVELSREKLSKLDNQLKKDKQERNEIVTQLAEIEKTVATKLSDLIASETSTKQALTRLNEQAEQLKADENLIKELGLLIKNTALSGYQPTGLESHYHRIIAGILQNIYQANPRFNLSSVTNHEFPAKWLAEVNFIFDKCKLDAKKPLDQVSLDKIVKTINEEFATDDMQVKVSVMRGKHTISTDVRHDLACRNVVDIVLCEHESLYLNMRPAKEIYSEYDYLHRLVYGLAFEAGLLESLCAENLQQYFKSKLLECDVDDLLNYHKSAQTEAEKIKSFTELQAKLLLKNPTDYRDSKAELAANLLARIDAFVKKHQGEFVASQVNDLLNHMLQSYKNALQSTLTQELQHRKADEEARILDNDPITKVKAQIASREKELEELNKVSDSKKNKVKEAEADIKLTEIDIVLVKEKYEEQKVVIETELNATLAKQKTLDNVLKKLEKDSAKDKKKIDDLSKDRKETSDKIAALTAEREKLDNDYKLAKEQLASFEKDRNTVTAEKEALTIKRKDAQERRKQAEEELTVIKNLFQFVERVREKFKNNREVYQHRHGLNELINKLELSQDASAKRLDALYKHIIGLKGFTDLVSAGVEAVIPKCDMFLFPELIGVIRECTAPPKIEWISSPEERCMITGFNISFIDAENALKNAINDKLYTLGLTLKDNKLVVRDLSVMKGFSELPAKIKALIEERIELHYLRRNNMWGEKSATGEKAQEILEHIELDYHDVVKCYADYIEIIAGNDIYVENNIEMPGISMALQAKKDIVLSSGITIKTSGKEKPGFAHARAYSGKDYRVGKPNGNHGDDGVDGPAGQSAGHIYLKAAGVIENVDTLKCLAVGGNGVNGQKAGHGDEGAKGVGTPDAEPTDTAGFGRAQLNIAFARIPGMDKDNKYTVLHEKGQKGGDAGAAGLGGKGGLAGDITIEVAGEEYNKPIATNFVSKIGEDGRDADKSDTKGGAGGDPGDRGCDVELYKQNFCSRTKRRMGRFDDHILRHPDTIRRTMWDLDLGIFGVSVSYGGYTHTNREEIRIDGSSVEQPLLKNEAEVRSERNDDKMARGANGLDGDKKSKSESERHRATVIANITLQAGHKMRLNKLANDLSRSPIWEQCQDRCHASISRLEAQILKHTTTIDACLVAEKEKENRITELNNDLAKVSAKVEEIKSATDKLSAQLSSDKAILEATDDAMLSMIRDFATLEHTLAEARAALEMAKIDTSTRKDLETQFNLVHSKLGAALELSKSIKMQDLTQKRAQFAQSLEAIKTAQTQIDNLYAQFNQLENERASSDAKKRELERAIDHIQRGSKVKASELTKEEVHVVEEYKQHQQKVSATSEKAVESLKVVTLYTPNFGLAKFAIESEAVKLASKVFSDEQASLLIQYKEAALSVELIEERLSNFEIVLRMVLADTSLNLEEKLNLIEASHAEDATRYLSSKIVSTDWKKISYFSDDTIVPDARNVSSFSLDSHYISNEPTQSEDDLNILSKYSGNNCIEKLHDMLTEYYNKAYEITCGRGSYVCLVRGNLDRFMRYLKHQLSQVVLENLPHADVLQLTLLLKLIAKVKTEFSAFLSEATLLELDEIDSTRAPKWHEEFNYIERILVRFSKEAKSLARKQLYLLYVEGLLARKPWDEYHDFKDKIEKTMDSEAVHALCFLNKTVASSWTHFANTRTINIKLQALFPTCAMNQTIVQLFDYLAKQDIHQENFAAVTRILIDINMVFSIEDSLDLNALKQLYASLNHLQQMNNDQIKMNAGLSAALQDLDYTLQDRAVSLIFKRFEKRLIDNSQAQTELKVLIHKAFCAREIGLKNDCNARMLRKMAFINQMASVNPELSLERLKLYLISSASPYDDGDWLGALKLKSFEPVLSAANNSLLTSNTPEAIYEALMFDIANIVDAIKNPDVENTTGKVMSAKAIDDLLQVTLNELSHIVIEHKMLKKSNQAASHIIEFVKQQHLALAKFYYSQKLNGCSSEEKHDVFMKIAMTLGKMYLHETDGDSSILSHILSEIIISANMLALDLLKEFTLISGQDELANTMIGKSLLASIRSNLKIESLDSEISSAAGGLPEKFDVLLERIKKFVTIVCKIDAVADADKEDAFEGALRYVFESKLVDNQTLLSDMLRSQTDEAILAKIKQESDAIMAIWLSGSTLSKEVYFAALGEFNAIINRLPIALKQKNELLKKLEKASVEANAKEISKNEELIKAQQQTLQEVEDALKVLRNKQLKLQKDHLREMASRVGTGDADSAEKKSLLARLADNIQHKDIVRIFQQYSFCLGYELEFESDKFTLENLAKIEGAIFNFIECLPAISSDDTKMQLMALISSLQTQIKAYYIRVLEKKFNDLEQTFVNNNLNLQEIAEDAKAYFDCLEHIKDKALRQNRQQFITYLLARLKSYGVDHKKLSIVAKEKTESTLVFCVNEAALRYILEANLFTDKKLEDSVFAKAYASLNKIIQDKSSAPIHVYNAWFLTLQASLVECGNNDMGPILIAFFKDSIALLKHLLIEDKLQQAQLVEFANSLSNVLNGLQISDSSNPLIEVLEQFIETVNFSAYKVNEYFLSRRILQRLEEGDPSRIASQALKNIRQDSLRQFATHQQAINTLSVASITSAELAKQLIEKLNSDSLLKDPGLVSRSIQELFISHEKMQNTLEGVDSADTAYLEKALLAFRNNAGNAQLANQIIKKIYLTLKKNKLDNVSEESILILSALIQSKDIALLGRQYLMAISGQFIELLRRKLFSAVLAKPALHALMRKLKEMDSLVLKHFNLGESLSLYFYLNQGLATLEEKDEAVDLYLMQVVTKCQKLTSDKALDQIVLLSESLTSNRIEAVESHELAKLCALLPILPLKDVDLGVLIKCCETHLTVDPTVLSSNNQQLHLTVAHVLLQRFVNDINESTDPSIGLFKARLVVYLNQIFDLINTLEGADNPAGISDRIKFVLAELNLIFTYLKSPESIYTMPALIGFLIHKNPSIAMEQLEQFLTPNEYLFAKRIPTEEVRKIILGNAGQKPISANLWEEHLKTAFWQSLSGKILSTSQLYLSRGNLHGNLNKLFTDAKSEDFKTLQLHLQALIYGDDLFAAHKHHKIICELIQLINPALPEDKTFLEGFAKQLDEILEFKKQLAFSYTLAHDKKDISTWLLCLDVLANDKHGYNVQDINHILICMQSFPRLEEVLMLLKSADNSFVIQKMLVQRFLFAAQKAVQINETDYKRLLDPLFVLNDPMFSSTVAREAITLLTDAILNSMKDGKAALRAEDLFNIIKQIVDCKAQHNLNLMTELSAKPVLYWSMILKRESIKQKLALDDSHVLQNRLVEYLLTIEKNKGKDIFDAFISSIKKQENPNIDIFVYVMKKFASGAWTLDEKCMQIISEQNHEQWIDQITKYNKSQEEVKKLERKAADIVSAMKKDNTGINDGVQRLLNGTPTVLEMAIAEIEALYARKYVKFSEDDIKKWAAEFKVGGNNRFRKLNDPDKGYFSQDTLIFLAVMMRAVALIESHKNPPRHTQLSAMLCFIDGFDGGKGRLANISTGEGKSLITKMLAVARVLKGERVDILTSSKVLAERDAKNSEDLFKLFGIGVSNNVDDECEKEEDKRAQRYRDCQVIYGEAGAFERDYLLSNYMGKSIRASLGHSLIIDEVDSACIDNAERMLYISHSVEDLNHLRELFLLIWSSVHNPDASHYTKKNVDTIVEYLQQQMANGSIKTPETLKKFIKRRLPMWVQNAYYAKFLDAGDKYVFAKEGEKRGQAVVMDLYTGVEQLNTQWSNGLHQFVQIKHRNKLTDESLKAVFISNMSFFRRYLGNINGMTGTMGSGSEMRFLSEIYNLDFFKLPRFRQERYIQEDGVVIPTTATWIQSIVDDVAEKMESNSEISAKEIGDAKKRERVIPKELESSKAMLLKVQVDIAVGGKKVNDMQEVLNHLENTSMLLATKKVSDEAELSHAIAVQQADKLRLMKRITELGDEIPALRSKDKGASDKKKIAAIEEQINQCQAKMAAIDKVLLELEATPTKTSVSAEKKKVHTDIQQTSKTLEELKKTVKTLETEEEKTKKTIAALEQEKTDVDNILQNKSERAVLIVCENQNAVKAIFDTLKAKYGEGRKIYRYESALQDLPVDHVGPGDIIVATNIAGRGTDLETTKSLERNGGLHVILSYMPGNIRVEDQAFGRTARKGNFGSGKFIVKDERSARMPITIEFLRDERDEQEASRLSDIQLTKVPRILVEEKLFDQYISLQRRIESRFRRKKSDDDFIKLQVKSLQDKWAMWLDKYAKEIDSVYKDGEAGIMARYEKFSGKMKTKAKTESFGLISSPGELMKLAKYYVKKEQYGKAETCFNSIIRQEPQFAAFAHYYKVLAMFGQGSSYGRRKEARTQLKRAIKLFEEALSRLSTLNQIVRVVGEQTQLSGKGLEPDEFSKSNINQMSFINIHMNAAKESLGQDLTEQLFKNGTITGDAAVLVYKNLRKLKTVDFRRRKLELVKDYRLSKKLSIGFAVLKPNAELDWSSLPIHDKLKANLSGNPDKEVHLDHLSPVEISALKNAGCEVSKELFVQKTKITFPKPYAYVKDGVITSFEAHLKDRELDLSTLETLFLTKDKFFDLLKNVLQKEKRASLHKDAHETAMGSLFWRDEVFLKHGKEIKKSLLSIKGSISADTLDKMILDCLADQKDIDQPKQLDLIKAKLKDSIIQFDNKYVFNARVQDVLRHYTTTLSLNYSKPSAVLNHLGIGKYKVFKGVSDIIVSKLRDAWARKEAVTIDKAYLGINEEQFNALWEVLYGNQLLKNDLLGKMGIEVDTGYQNEISYLVLSYYKKGEFTQADVQLGEKAEEEVLNLWRHLKEVGAVKDPAIQFGLMHEPKDRLNLIKDAIQENIGRLIDGINDAEADKYKEGIQDAIEKAIGKIKVLPALKLSEKSLHDYFREGGKMPPEIMDYTRRCLDGVLSLIEDKGWWDWDAFLCALIGLAQLVAGVLLTAFTGGALSYLGQVLIKEGVGDIVFAVQSSISGNFSWKAYGEHKLISLVISIATVGFGALVSGGEGAYALANGIPQAAVMSAVKSEIINQTLGAMISVGVNLATSSLSNMITRDIFNHFKATFKKDVENCAAYNKAKASLSAKFAAIYRKFGASEANTIVAKCMNEVNLVEMIEGQLGTQVLKYAQMAAGELAKFSDHKYWGGKFQVVGLIGDIVSKSLSVASALKIITEMTENTANVVKALETALDKALNKNLSSSKQMAEGAAASEEVVKAFCDERLKQTTDSILSKIEAYVQSSILQPAAQLGVQFAVDKMTSGLRNELGKEMEVLRQRAELEHALEDTSRGKWELNQKLRLEAIEELKKLPHGKVLDPAAMAGKSDATVKFGDTSMTAAEAIEMYKDVYFIQKEDGLHLIKPDYSQSLRNIAAGISAGKFELRALATHAKVKIVLLDGDLNPHESAPKDGINPFGDANVKAEVALALEDGHYVPCVKGEDGKWQKVDLSASGMPNNSCAAQAMLYALKYQESGNNETVAKEYAQNADTVKGYLSDVATEMASNALAKEYYYRGDQDLTPNILGGHRSVSFETSYGIGTWDSGRFSLFGGDSMYIPNPFSESLESMFYPSAGLKDMYDEIMVGEMFQKASTSFDKFLKTTEGQLASSALTDKARSMAIDFLKSEISKPMRAFEDRFAFAASDAFKRETGRNRASLLREVRSNARLDYRAKQANFANLFGKAAGTGFILGDYANKLWEDPDKAGQITFETVRDKAVEKVVTSGLEFAIKGIGYAGSAARIANPLATILLGLFESTSTAPKGMDENTSGPLFGQESKGVKLPEMPFRGVADALVMPGAPTGSRFEPATEFNIPVRE